MSDETGSTWVDSHCHLPDDPARGRRRHRPSPSERASSGWSASAPISPPLGPRWRSRSAGPTSSRRSDSIPHDAVRLADEWAGLVALAAGPRRGRRSASAGLDHHYEHSPGPDQAEAFRAQIRLAHELDRTLVIHTREAWDETFSILDDEGVPAAHGVPLLHRWARRGGRMRSTAAPSLSFSGIVTFKNADDVRAAAAIAPADRMLVETDSPYLAPVPHRGRPNRAGMGSRRRRRSRGRSGESVGAIAEATKANAAATVHPAADAR